MLNGSRAVLNDQPLRTAAQVYYGTSPKADCYTEAEWSTDTSQLRVTVQHSGEMLILAEKGLMRRRNVSHLDHGSDLINSEG